MNTTRAAEILESILAWFGRHPHDVIVMQTISGLTGLITIRCHPEDARRFIGRGGVALEALGYIVRALWDRAGISADIATGGILDNGSDAPPGRTAWDEEWRKEFERGAILLAESVFPDGKPTLEWVHTHKARLMVNVHKIGSFSDTSDIRHRLPIGVQRVLHLAGRAHGRHVEVEIGSCQSGAILPTPSPA